MPTGEPFLEYANVRVKAKGTCAINILICSYVLYVNVSVGIWNETDQAVGSDVSAVKSPPYIVN